MTKPKVCIMSKEGRLKRRRQIAAEVAGGRTVEQVAYFWNLPAGFVRQCCRTEGVRVSKIRDRRKAIVGLLREGRTVGEVSETFGVGLRAIYDAVIYAGCELQIREGK